MTQSPEVSIVADGRGLVESPRWHQGQFWFADWSVGEILSIDDQGACRVRARAPAPPLCFDFAADGDMLIVPSAQGLLLKQNASGQGAILARLGPGIWNEIVVDGRGNAYVNGPSLLLIRPDGQVSQDAEGFAFPNGMVVFPDNRRLVVAESHAMRLTAFDVSPDGPSFGAACLGATRGATRWHLCRSGRRYLVRRCPQSLLPAGQGRGRNSG
jgi:sugar lactone lactonase YvrE